VLHNSPIIFDASVAEAIDGVTRPAPTVRPPSADERLAVDPTQLVPPADPLTELDPKKARDFSIGGAVNALWKVFLIGDKVVKAGAAWHRAGEALQPYVEPILEWLRSYKGP
jgi:hypothetical protein